MKLVVNQAYENMGLGSTQTLGPILDGLMRNTPDALGVHRAGGARRRPRRVARARRTVRRLQPGAAGAAARPGQRDRPVRPSGATARAATFTISVSSSSGRPGGSTRLHAVDARGEPAGDLLSGVVVARHERDLSCELFGDRRQLGPAILSASITAPTAPAIPNRSASIRG